MTYAVQFTTRRIDPVTGEPSAWSWGPYASLQDAKAAAKKGRAAMLKGPPAIYGWRKCGCARCVRITVARDGVEHAVKRGRPKALFDLEAAERLLREGISVREVAKRLGVSRATLQRATEGGPKLTGGRARGRK